MAFEATKPQKPFEPAPEGLHPVRLAWLIELGTFDDTYEGVTKEVHRLLLGFELVGTEMSDGRPFLLSKEYNVTKSKFGGHYLSKTSNMFKLAKDWLKADEKTASRIGTFAAALGAPGQMLVSHEEYTKDGQKRTKVKIDAIKPFSKPCADLVNPIINYSIGDVFPETLPDWIKKKVASSKEMTVTTTEAQQEVTQPEVQSQGVAIDDNDVPF
jgi:hypothetical protein